MHPFKYLGRCIMMLPIIVTVLHLTLLTSITASGVELATSSQKFVSSVVQWGKKDLLDLFYC